MNVRSLAPLLTLLALTASACGKRGDPLPPLRRSPLPVADLRLAQRGTELIVTFTTPRTTIGGVALGLMEVQLEHGFGTGDFAKLAVRKSLRAAPGEALVERLPLPAPGTLVRYKAVVRADGQLSPEAAPPHLVTQEPPEPPKNVVAEVIPEGLRLRFTPAPLPTPSPTPAPTASPATAAPGASPAAVAPSPTATGTPAAVAPSPTAGGTPAAPPMPTPAPTPPLAGTLIYRRAHDGAYALALTRTPIADAVYEDTAVALDARVCYELRTAVSTSPLIESAPTGEVCLVRRDIVPPTPPRGLTALERAGGVDLEWSPAPDADVTAYRVYRSAGGGAPVRLAEVAETRYRDDALPEGARVLVYQVAAVDRGGNEGPLSVGVPARRP